MYAVTIKKTGSQNYVQAHYYDKYIAFLTRCFDLFTYHFELDSKKRLHVHCLCEKNPYKVLSCYNNEVHTKIRKCYDKDSWIAYLKKDANNKYEDEQILIDNEVQHRYLFIN